MAMASEEPAGSDESVTTYLESLREDLRGGRISEFFWVPTTEMTADGGTKAVTDELMCKIMREGGWWPSEYKVIRRGHRGVITGSSAELDSFARATEEDAEDAQQRDGDDLAT